MEVLKQQIIDLNIKPDDLETAAKILRETTLENGERERQKEQERLENERNAKTPNGKLELLAKDIKSYLKQKEKDEVKNDILTAGLLLHVLYITGFLLVIIFSSSTAIVILSILLCVAVNILECVWLWNHIYARYHIMNKLDKIIAQVEKRNNMTQIVIE